MREIFPKRSFNGGEKLRRNPRPVQPPTVTPGKKGVMHNSTNSKVFGNSMYLFGCVQKPPSIPGLFDSRRRRNRAHKIPKAKYTTRGADDGTNL